MAIATYSDLQNTVADWLNRSDLSSVIPDFITNAESRLNARVRVRDMMTTTSVSFDASGEITLPNDYLETVFVSTNSTPVARPEYAEPDSAEFLFRFRPNSVPQYYSILGTKLRVQPVYTGAGSHVYYARIPALSAQNNTNWLLSKGSDVYLYSALLEGAFFLKDETAAAGYAQKLEQAIQTLQQVDRAARVNRAQAQPAMPSQKTVAMATS